ncbi:hypothetical protein DF186_17345, partial [Enterococcus hirae]
AEPAQDELEDAGGLEGTVGEVAVKTGGDGEHADQVGYAQGGQGDPAETSPEYQYDGQVQDDEGAAADPVNLVEFLVVAFGNVGCFHE